MTDDSPNPHAAALGTLAIETVRAFGETTVLIPAASIVDACRLLRDRGFNRLSAITAVDWHPQEPRFEIVYHLHALPLHGGKQERLRLKARVDGASAEINSVTSVWEGAGWYEREVFDLFGVNFPGHPDLTRILMPDYWEGHPLRKDYPIDGYKYSYTKEI
jgi:NADH-quinone oxidoreductase subunit C